MIEFIGFISPQRQSEIQAPSGPVVDPEYIAAFTRAHEQSGFDRVLVGYYAAMPDGFMTAAYALAATRRISTLIAHRPGFVAPTLAARKLATLDQLYGGRVAVHMITGGDDKEQTQDGDWTTKEQRYRRTDEYIEILRKTWTSPEPFDHEGEFYRLAGAFSKVRCVAEPHMPVYFGGSSDEALEVAAKHADVYAFWGEPLADSKAHIDRVLGMAARYSRAPRFSLSTRPILGKTDAEAWERAYNILGLIKERVPGPVEPPPNAGSRRLLAAAARGEVHDLCLWTAPAAATNARGSTTALVGSPETVARAMLDYYDIGVTTFLIRGFEPFEDAVDYGRELIPLVRSEVARRERSSPAV